MKLSRLYSNQPDLFDPIDFNPGLNVVLAEIRLPENQDKDTHNLGKTTVGTLIDFCLLSGRDPKMFLYKHAQRFQNFVFYLEVELPSSAYVTIRRSVITPTRISFKRHLSAGQDFTDLPDDLWDHLDVAFDRSRQILDGLLDLTGFSPWHYRKGLGYMLRSQEDYRDVFQLNRFAAAHSDWKPFIAHMLGFDSQLIESYYGMEAKVDGLRGKEATLQRELGGSIEDLSKVEGMLLLKEKRAIERQELLDSFDFRSQDKDRTKQLVDEVDEQIAALNGERYSLMHSRRKVTASLDEGQMFFDPDDAAKLFGEVGVFFGGQLKHDFEQLIAFNKAITEERRGYLLEEKAEIDLRLRAINAELNRLGKRRSEGLAFLKDSTAIEKYKSGSQELVQLQADVISLKRQRETLQAMHRLRIEIRDAAAAAGVLEVALEREFDDKNDSRSEGVYTEIRVRFDAIVKTVLDQNALLTVSLNQAHHPEFDAQILDETGRETSAQRGHTYQKLLCIAFDLALLRTHIGAGFPQFVYHDGVFESLDRRKKTNLVAVIRENVAAGLQQIITLIDTDMPPSVDGEPPFADDEIVVRLHDEGEDGRLFKMASW